MNTHSLFKRLRKLQSTMQTHHPRLNYGGCGVFAYLVGEQLQKLGLEVEIVTPTDGGYYLSASRVRSNVTNKERAREWTDNGLCRQHLAVRFKTKAGVVYTYDSDRLARSASSFGGDYDYTDPKFGTGLTVKETKLMCKSQDGWNNTFPRKSIPKVKSQVSEAFA